MLLVSQGSSTSPPTSSPLSPPSRYFSSWGGQPLTNILERAGREPFLGFQERAGSELPRDTLATLRPSPHGGDGGFRLGVNILCLFLWPLFYRTLSLLHSLWSWRMGHWGEVCPDHSWGQNCPSRKYFPSPHVRDPGLGPFLPDPVSYLLLTPTLMAHPVLSPRGSLTAFCQP